MGTLAASPSEPVPEVRVAAGLTALLVLDAPVDKGSVQWEATRVRLVDVGERTRTLARRRRVWGCGAGPTWQNLLTREASL